MRMRYNLVLTVVSVLMGAIIGVLFAVAEFGVLNVVCTELVVLPTLFLLIGASFENRRASLLIKTVASLALVSGLVANALMGACGAEATAYVIVDGLLLIVVGTSAYQLARMKL